MRNRWHPVYPILKESQLVEGPKQGLHPLQNQLAIHFGHVLPHYQYDLPDAYYVDSGQRNYPIYDRRRQNPWHPS